jgi:hypothetical protein
MALVTNWHFIVIQSGKKKQKKGKQSNGKETKTRILLLEYTITIQKKSSRKNRKEGKENKLLLEF